MKRKIHSLFRTCLTGALLLVCALKVSPVQGANVSTDGRKILVNGEIFEARGVCYAPTPIGQTGSQVPHGDYFTAEYGALYHRDLALMREMGVNCLRIYGWNPAANHQDFLDAAYNNGRRPIYVLINRWVNPDTAWTNTAATDGIAAEWAGIASSVKEHPAILGYIIGNELNWSVANRMNPDFWVAINKVAGAIRQRDTNHIISTALADAGVAASITAFDGIMTNFNAWCLQAYRGKSFGMLFREYSLASTKPMLITEFGMDAFDQRTGAEYPDKAMVQADYVASLWNDIVWNGHVASGGLVFEWLDEWWKAGNIIAHNEGGWAGGQFPDGWADEEWWGIYRVAKGAAGQADTLEPRAVATTLKSLWTAALSIAAQTSGSIEVRVQGGVGQRAILQATSSLSAPNWIPVATNTVPFTNSIAADPQSAVFFRVELGG